MTDTNELRRLLAEHTRTEDEYYRFPPGAGGHVLNASIHARVAWELALAHAAPSLLDAADEREKLKTDYHALRWDIGVVRDERDALRADAERYRWLRDNINVTVSHWFCTAGGPELDAAIDAAMKEPK